MRATIVGAGAIAHAHASALAELAEHDGAPAVETTHVVDLDLDRARAFADQHGIAGVATDVEALLAAGDVDVLHICTPPSAHFATAAAALRAGVHVVLEKPPVLSLAQLDELVALEAASSAQLTVIVQHRFGHGAVQLRSLLADGALGRPLVAVCNTLWFRDAEYFAAPWRGRWDTEGGGPTMGHGIHQFDLLLSILGPWTDVTAVAARQARDTDTEDVSMALVRFESGAMASIVNSVVSPSQVSEIRIDTEAATVALTHLYGYTDEDWTFTPAPGREEAAALWRPDPTALPSGHLAQLLPTYRALAQGAPLPVTSADARRTLELAAAIYRSAFTGRPVAAGEIGADDAFARSMDGTGAPWGPAWAPVSAGVPG
ncbi:Gfo/Idh/MocA family protein [Oerskovia flava]|uniref:Gfo/Idh/MocA family protein n=1 Tax=Oerskovia flava TaxID=2986422 RepID=UPI00223F3565|nr:Gfo/Idh/MocA family oxidoreductase [Oerskovia sp. JB1-3-2]